MTGHGATERGLTDACAADERGDVAERYKEALPAPSIGKSCALIEMLANPDVKALGTQPRKTGVL